MPDDHYLIELLVYSSTEEKFGKQFIESRERRIDDLYAQAGQPAVGKDRDWLKKHFFDDRSGEALRRFGGPWRFNQVVGAIGIYALGSQLRGDLWLTTAKAVRKDATKRHINYLCQAFVMDVDPGERSEEVFASLLKRVQKLMREKPLQGRLIDARVLELIGRFVDWRSLMDLSTIRDTQGLRLDNLEPLPGRQTAGTTRKKPGSRR